MKRVHPEAALEKWAMLQFGILHSAGHFRAANGEPGLVLDEPVISQVERFFEIENRRRQFRSLAMAVYGKGVSAKDFQWQLPGVTKLKCLLHFG